MSVKDLSQKEVSEVFKDYCRQKPFVPKKKDLDMVDMLMTEIKDFISEHFDV